MTAPTHVSGEQASAKRVIVAIELAGYTKAFQANGDEVVARFVDAYYALCERTLASGTIIKFMGDACLATFDTEAVVSAVVALHHLQRGLDEVSQPYGLSLELGANVHIATVIQGEFGAGSSRRFDIIGRGVNQTFLLGRGPGIRISEPVYRQLPNDARRLWSKHKPPAIYHLTRAPGVLEGLGKDGGTNTGRW